MAFKKLGVALLATLALSAVIASASQAAMWNSSGKGTFSSGTSVAAKARQKSGTTGILVSKVLGSPFKLTATGLEAKEGKIVQTSTAAQLTGKLNFTGVTVDEPAGCKSSGNIETTALTGTAQMGNTEATKGSVYVKIAPTSGENFATITLKECAAAGSYVAKGTVYVKATNPTGTAAVWQEANSSGEINSSQGGALTLGKEAATLTGTIEVATEAEETYSLLE